MNSLTMNCVSVSKPCSLGEGSSQTARGLTDLPFNPPQIPTASHSIGCHFFFNGKISQLSSLAIVKTRCSKLPRFFFVLWLMVWAVVPRATAQPRPSLGLQFSAGQPTLSLTAEVGTVYSIQHATGLFSTNLWVDRTLLQAQRPSNVWTDPSAPSTSQRFYRAVSVAAPADTNLVFIQPGTFTMGSPTNEAERSSDEVQHNVTISRGFWMEKYLVTQGDYLGVVGSNPSYFTSANGYSEDLTRPVEEVSWYDATNYCGLRTQQERAAGLIPTNYVYRLPTESEWEYVARAGTRTAFYLGSGLNSGQANFDGQHEYDASVGTIYNPNGILLGQTTAVGSYAANGWGLYDMIGNVWEWCQDWYGVYPGGSVIDPQGPVAGSTKVFRGGRWGIDAVLCRSAFRVSDRDPGYRSERVGFRVVLAPG
jgi:formylglycine-generating enzyme required for sulfatase activity